MHQKVGFAHNILEHQKDLIQAFLDCLFYKFSNNGAYPFIFAQGKEKRVTDDEGQDLLDYIHSCFTLICENGIVILMTIF